MVRVRWRHAFWCALVWTLAATASAAERNVATVEFFSECVGRKLKYNVALPANYDSSDRRYPVLYLLHGFSGNYTQWARFGAPSAAKTHELIVVMPDGGNSWYIRWAGSEAGQKNDWEGAIVKDLVAHVDSTYRTIAAREGRAIGGLSMGGYGAVVLGLRHPDLFCSIGSYSGALNYARNSAERLARGESLRPSEPPATQDNPQIGSPGFNSQAERTPAGDPFRDRKSVV